MAYLKAEICFMNPKNPDFALWFSKNTTTIMSQDWHYRKLALLEVLKERRYLLEHIYDPALDTENIVLSSKTMDDPSLIREIDAVGFIFKETSLREKNMDLDFYRTFKNISKGAK
jgi:hypothetical protein